MAAWPEIVNLSARGDMFRSEMALSASFSNLADLFWHNGRISWHYSMQWWWIIFLSQEFCDVAHDSLLRFHNLLFQAELKTNANKGIKEKEFKQGKQCFQRWNRCGRFKVVRLSSSIPWDLRHAEQLLFLCPCSNLTVYRRKWQWFFLHHILWV